jgi:hypothetical protein
VGQGAVEELKLDFYLIEELELDKNAIEELELEADIGREEEVELLSILMVTQVQWEQRAPGGTLVAQGTLKESHSRQVVNLSK